MATILSRKPGGSGGGGAPSGPAGGDLAGTYPNPTIDPTAAVISVAKSGSAQLAGDVTLSQGANVTLTQVGQDIEIAAAGGAGLVETVFDSTLGADAANFDVTPIAATWEYLQILISGRSAAAALLDGLAMRFNNDSGNNYDTQYVEAAGGAVAGNQSLAQPQFGQSAAARLGFVTAASAPAGASSDNTIWVYRYADTTFHKGVVAEGAARYSGTFEQVRSSSSGGWRNTAAITRITLFLISGSNFLAGTRCTIYGYGV